MEQGPRTNILVRDAGRQSRLILDLLFGQDGKQAYDDYYYRERQQRHVCRTSLSGFPADVIGSYHLGQYGLMARWEAEWGGEDRGKWLLATIMSFSVDKAIELRAVLHTIQPVTGQ